MELDNYDKYKDEYIPDPPGRRKPQFCEEGLYESAYEDDEEE